jgi:type II secretory pathway pseudopilin PulG
MRTQARRHEAGFTYVAILLAVAMFGAILAAVSTVWYTAQKREKERELLFVGDQFRKALRSYAAGGAGVAGVVPQSLDDLLRDPRAPGVKRHLRKIFVDPMTGTTDWGLMKTPDGKGIVGVYSQSEDAPLKTANFGDDDKSFEGKTKYSDWKFVSNVVALAGDKGPQQPSQPTAPGVLAPGLQQGATPAPVQPQPAPGIQTGAAPVAPQPSPPLQTGTAPVVPQPSPETQTGTAPVPPPPSPAAAPAPTEPATPTAPTTPPTPAAPQPQPEAPAPSSSPFSPFGTSPLQPAPFTGVSPGTQAPAPAPAAPAPAAPAPPAAPSQQPAAPVPGGTPAAPAPPAAPSQQPAAPAPSAPPAAPAPSEAPFAPTPLTPSTLSQPAR